MEAFLIRYNTWATEQQRKHLAEHKDGVPPHLMALVCETEAALHKIAITVELPLETLLDHTNTATSLRGRISGLLCMAGLKPLALDALYVRAETPITGKGAKDLLLHHAQQSIDEYKALFALMKDSVSDEQYHANSGLCFRSIHGTLNHMLLGDLVWYERLHGKAEVSRFDSFWERPDEELYATRDSAKIDWEEYIANRTELSMAIIKQALLWREFVEGLDNVLENQFEKGLGRILFHAVNHGYHHRGQVFATLKTLGIAV
ncbi:UNVERIFIED_CONTAM: hypothetical protein HDU68_009991 [Siphonaria sp. JEL0065]|nr:hypothetical protein HDU68_009991 [Siphonaria sp. JEL0065]